MITRTQAEQSGLSQDQAELWTELELVKHSVMLPCPRRVISQLHIRTWFE